MTTLHHQIVDNMDLPPNQFQIFLEKIYDQEPVEICIALAEMLYPKHPNSLPDRRQHISKEKEKQERQKLATSLNFLIERSFKVNDKNPQLWKIYVQTIASREEKPMPEELSEWKISKILQKSFYKFTQTFEQEFTVIMQATYFELNPTHKILLQALTHLDVDQQALILFLTETLHQYIDLGHWQLRELAKLSDEEGLVFLDGRFTDYLTNLYDSLVYLNRNSRDGNPCEYFINQVCGSNQLFWLVQKCIFIKIGNPTDNDTHSTAKDTSSPIQKLFTFTGTSHRQESLHNIRALGLQIFTTMLSRYSHKSTIVEFDQSKCLSLMENLVPSIVEELTKIRPNQLNLTCNEKLTIACLGVVKKSVQFLFMNNFMWEQYPDIFWTIIFQLLTVSDQQIREYQDDADLFVSQAETLVEKEEDDPEKIQSCKTYAAFLLDTITEHIDGSLTKIVTGTINLLETCLDARDCQQKLAGKSVSDYKLEACLTVLKILSGKIKRRADLQKPIKQIFVSSCSRIIKLKGIDKCRAIMFLCYNFQEILMNKGQEKANAQIRQEYYHWIAGSLEQDQAITKICLDFYETYCKLEPSTVVILEQLVTLVQSTKSVQLLETLQRTLPQTITSLPPCRIKQILNKCIDRIFHENTQYIHSIRTSEVYSNLVLIKCMHIVRAVALEVRRLDDEDQQKEIMEVLWRVFDLFQCLDDAAYGEELIKIFDAVLSYVPVLDGPHFFQFLPNFGQYHKKQKQIGRLFYTYIVLITKAHNYLTTSPDSQQILAQIVQNLLIVIRYGFKTRSTICITLLQYILLKFPCTGFPHKWIYKKTRQLFSMHSNLSCETVCAIYNLWIIGSVSSAEYDLGELDGYCMEDVYGYHAKMFAIAVNAKIRSLLCEIKEAHTNVTTISEENIKKIQYLLRKTVEFLQAQKKNKNKNSQLQYKIQQYVLTNPNQKIRQVLVTLKTNLPEADYNHIMTQLETLISRTQLKQLLEQKVRDTRVIYRFKS